MDCRSRSARTRRTITKSVASLGPAFLLDDDIVDGDVFDRQARLNALGLAAFIYSSHSYGFGKMGGRVGVCLNRPYD